MSFGSEYYETPTVYVASFCKPCPSPKGDGNQGHANTHPLGQMLAGGKNVDFES